MAARGYFGDDETVTSYFDDDSMVRRVHRESVVALSGPRTLLMQAAHPVAFTGFFAHTGALDDPWIVRGEEKGRATLLVQPPHHRQQDVAVRPHSNRAREFRSVIHGNGDQIVGPNLLKR